MIISISLRHVGSASRFRRFGVHATTRQIADTLLEQLIDHHRLLPSYYSFLHSNYENYRYAFCCPVYYSLGVCSPSRHHPSLFSCHPSVDGQPQGLLRHGSRWRRNRKVRLSSKPFIAVVLCWGIATKRTASTPVLTCLFFFFFLSI